MAAAAAASLHIIARVSFFFPAFSFPSVGCARVTQVKFLKDRIGRIPVRLVFESALELMSSTSIGEFSMAQVTAG